MKQPIEEINKFMKNTIEEAYTQLQLSANHISNSLEMSVPIVKVILLYDDFSNTEMLQKSVSRIFEEDGFCFIMTIREFEILLYLYYYENSKFKEILDCIVSQETITFLDRKSISTIYDKFAVWNISHFTGDLDYFSKAMLRLDCELR